MRYLTAIVFPWFPFIALGRMRDARVCMALQLTVVGWIPATLWALRAQNPETQARRGGRSGEAK
ncbi:YqaE/Pmp3 family membrane protein [Paraburkholderia fungorum]|uniref:YqaE/Pmp3 family membrane protein n=1 Tax=Paraburkholderia fungorum TaxID=134537 RepID=UPI00402B197E